MGLKIVFWASGFFSTKAPLALPHPLESLRWKWGRPCLKLCLVGGGGARYCTPFWYLWCNWYLYIQYDTIMILIFNPPFGPGESAWSRSVKNHKNDLEIKWCHRQETPCRKRIFCVWTFLLTIKSGRKRQKNLPNNSECVLAKGCIYQHSLRCNRPKRPMFH